MDIALQVTHENGVDRVRYVGPINEESEVHLGQLLSKLGPKCEINFSGIEYVNSCGVRAWINFMRELEKGRQVSFVECPPEIVMQINMIPSFRGKASVKSVFASYECSSCGHNEQILFEHGRNMPANDGSSIPPVKCVKCGEDMEMEEMEDEYFAFTVAA
jgi:hypothetical protein